MYLHVPACTCMYLHVPACTCMYHERISMYLHVSACICTYHARVAISHDIRFEMCCAGQKPKEVKKFEQLQGICEALVVVEMTTDNSSCVECDANPFQLLCCCKGSRKISVCYHILFVTHLIMKAKPKKEQKAINNLHYMAGKIAGSKKKKGGSHRIKHCLQREDSSDEEEHPAVQLIKW